MKAIDVTGNVPDSTYSWADVQGTLRAIMNHELAKLTQNPRPPQWFNMADNVASTNPGDHFDHYATTQAALLAGATAHHRVFWVSYATAGRPANLPAGLLAAKRTLFYAYADSVHAATGMGMDYFHNEWRQWGPKSYARVVRARAAS
ncbi:hypothetical protein [Saccharopolyspora sp. CA-218241]|uniref:hypothetical protein n=1 Tax=Saccharopolyspora sp. CA-218241 TaxID=3240027 RepID=UPI003D9916BF